MTETSKSVSELEGLAGSVAYKRLNQSNERSIATAVVDSDLSSSELPQNDTATNVVLATGPEKYENKNCFYALRDRRKGLVFQSLRKVKGIFDVFVQVDYVKYYGSGTTQSKANDDCAAKVLEALDTGEHDRQFQALYNNAFNTLKKMYTNLLYKILTSSENKYEVYVNVEGIDYFGEGKTIHEANNDTAFTALKSIWCGDHKKQLLDVDEYWFDDDKFSSTNSSSEYFSCICSCHHCSCCH